MTITVIMLMVGMVGNFILLTLIQGKIDDLVRHLKHHDKMVKDLTKLTGLLNDDVDDLQDAMKVVKS